MMSYLRKNFLPTSQANHIQSRPLYQEIILVLHIMLFQPMRYHCNDRLNSRDIDNLYIIIPEVLAGYKCPMRSSQQVDIRFGISR